MRARIKRWFKRLLKTGGVFVLIGIGVLIGLVIGVNTADARQTVIIRGDAPFLFEEGLETAVEYRFEEQLGRQIQTRIEEQTVVDIPPIPTIPPIPEMPTMPTTIHIERGGPNFFDVVNGIGTVLASFGLIGLGIVMIVRGRRQQIKEKSPESVNK